MSKIDDRLQELGITLPAAPQPGGSYAPVVLASGMAFVAGQIPAVDGKIGYTGAVGRDADEDSARAAARTCALNILAALRSALDGDLDRVRRCVKLGVFVQCVEGFDRQPEVANSASDLMLQVFGEAGRHARFAVGANALPRNVTVEIDAIFEID